MRAPLLLLLLALASVASSACDFYVPSTTAVGTDIQTFLNGATGDVVVCLNSTNTFAGCTPVTMETSDGGSATLSGNSVGGGGARPLLNCSSATQPFLAITGGVDAVVSNIEIALSDSLASVTNAAASLTLTNVRAYDGIVSAVTTTTPTTITLTSCEFSDMGGVAGLTNVNGSVVDSSAAATVSVYSSRFDSNNGLTGGVFHVSGGGLVSLHNSTFYNNIANDGGVLGVTNNPATTHINACTFTLNTAMDGNGGALALTTPGCETNVSASTFDGNSAAGEAGAVYDYIGVLNITDGSVFENSDSDTGAVFGYSTSMLVSGSTFRNNVANSGSGAAIRLDEWIGNGGALVLSGSHFATHYSFQAGGAVYVYGGVTANVTRTDFTACSCQWGGGAVTGEVGPSLTFANSTFTECSTPGSGGALSMLFSELSVSECVFWNNTANGNGGAIEFSGTMPFSLTQSTFTYNTGGSGGAVFARDAAPFTVTECVFALGSGSTGGALYSRDCPNYVVADCTFTANTGSGNGGCLYSQDTTEAVLSGCNFTQCDSSNDGHALHVRRADSVYVYNSSFTGTRALGDAATVFVDSQANGPIALFDNITIADNTVANDLAGLVVDNYVRTYVTNSVITGNSALEACGIAHLKGLHVHLNSTYSTDNRVNISYAVCIEAEETSVVHDFHSLRNSAHSAAGLDLYALRSASVTDSVFSDNSARVECGGLQVRTGNVYLDSVLVGSNRAESGGGMVVHTGANVTVGAGGLVVEGNRASEGGGGVMCVACTVAVANVSVVSNTARFAAGLWVVDANSTVALNDSVIARNHATQSSGGVRVEGSAVFVRTEVSCNSVAFGGGGVAGLEVLGAGAAATLTNDSTVYNNYFVNTSSGLFPSFSTYPDDILSNVAVGANSSLTGYSLVPDQDPRFCLGLLCANTNVCVNGGVCVDPDPVASTYGTAFCNCSAALGTNIEPSTCAALCGNSATDSGEECDDGNVVDGDGCSSVCVDECGNGMLDGGEECDDNNRANDDGCSANCTLECGNGVLDGSEECDDSNRVNDDGCDANCTLECGNGMLNTGEECDEGDRLNNDGCDANCTLECGNGQVDGSEECDEGDTLNGDGCDSNCMLECGNGQVDGGEECDDSNTISGDGCSAACEIEPTTPPTKCRKNQWQRKGQCVTCPYGGYCNGGPDVLPLPGFWSPDSRSPPTECPVYDACPGVVNEDGDPVNPPLEYDSAGRPITDACREDYTDAVCSKCQSKRLKDGQRCVPCPSDAASTAGGLVFVTAAIVVVLAIAVAVLSDHHVDMLVAGILVAQMFVLVGRDATKHIPGEAGRRAASVYRYFSVITFDMDFMQLGCSREEALEFADVFWGTLALVVIASSLFSLAATINATQRWARGKLTHPYLTSLFYGVVHVNVLLGVAAYVQVTLRVLQGLNCVQVYGKPYLHVELATKCYSGRHLALSVVAWALMLLYVLAFPVFVLYIAWMRPADLRASDSDADNSSNVKGKAILAVDYSHESSDSYTSETSRTSNNNEPVIASSTTPKVDVRPSTSSSSRQSHSYTYASSSDSEGARASNKRESGSESLSYTYDTSSEEEQQQQTETQNSPRAVAKDAHAYRSMYGFLIRNLHKHAYWFQSLRLAVVFVIVLDVVVPRNTSFKLLGGAVILLVNVVVVGVVWPFKSRFGNIFQILSGLLTSLQTIVFLQEVVDPRFQSLVMFGITLALLVIVSGVIGVNLFRNRSLLFHETSSASDSWVSESESEYTYVTESSSPILRDLMLYG